MTIRKKKLPADTMGEKQKKSSIDEVVEELKEEIIEEPVAQPDGEPTSSEEITKILRTVDETTNVSKEIFMKVEFDFDSDIINPVSYSILDKLGTALRNFDAKENTLLIYGHSDSDGPSKYNLDLSERRASSVKQYLIDHFEYKLLDIQSKGFGEFQPLFPNTSEMNKMKNRRVEIMMKYDNNRQSDEGINTP